MPSRKAITISRASSRPGLAHTTTAAGVADPIRVACIPAGHDYSRALAGWGGSPVDTLTVSHLPDPPPLVAPHSKVSPGQWWPPRMLDSGWITENRLDFDLAHVQFGTEQIELPALADACDALRASGKPLIVTVHDLVNPQLHSDAESQQPHREHLDLLLSRADQVITLTPGAAAEIARRWCRTVEVIAHPSIVAPDIRLPLGTQSVDAVISVHLGDLRPNVSGLATVVTLIAATDALRGRGISARVRVHLRSRVRNQSERDAVIRACAASVAVEVVESDRYSDGDLMKIAADTDVCVLPYGHGTHSGWLELYYDLGVGVVTSDIGFFREQHDDAGFFFPTGRSGAPITVDSTADALAAALSHPLFARAGSAARARVQRERRALRDSADYGIRRAHARLYRRALEAMSS